MFKVLVLNDGSSSPFFSWLPWLEQNFEITQIKNLESVAPVLNSWAPHILISHSSTISCAQISKQFKISQQDCGWVVVADQYRLKEEIDAFEHGADHYLLVNTPIESLKTRLRALAIKAENSRIGETGPRAHSLPTVKSQLQVAEISINLQHQLVLVKNQVRQITPTQYRILELFFTHPNQVLSREKIQAAAFKGKDISSRSIDAQIAKLKRTIPELQSKIVNQYGQGYLFIVNSKKVA